MFAIPPLSCWMAIAACVGAPILEAQSSYDPPVTITPRRVIMPRAVRIPVEISRATARISIEGNRAQTELTLTVRNSGAANTEAELLLPVPEGAIVKGFSYGNGQGKYTASLLPAQEARRLYDSIVARALDPALLEFAGFAAIRTSVFPVPARSEVTLTIVYDQVVSPENGRFDYILPRSESLEKNTEWQIRAEIAPPCTNVYSPTHDMETAALQNGTTVLTLPAARNHNPGAFRLSWQGSAPTPGIPQTTVYACPNSENPKNGYFMLMIGGDSITSDAKAAAIPREITLVIDRSGSMRGDKLDKVKESVKQIIAGLQEGESFNLITYNEGVELFSHEPVLKTPEQERRAFEWIDGMNARGGTNIHKALKQALAPAVRNGTLPLVIFMTDGMPTIGTTSEKAILQLAASHNPGKRRIFTVGVGEDVNAPLLRNMAETSRAVPTYILPKEDVETKMASLFRRLGGPVLADVELTLPGDVSRTGDMVPSTIGDIYNGLPALVTGTYKGTSPFNILVKATRPDGIRIDIPFTVDPGRISTQRDDFVGRLWASRQIGRLQAALTDMGANIQDTAALQRDPKTKEIIEEIIRLSIEFGIMSDFTSFFADDGSRAAHPAGTPLRLSDPHLRASAWSGFAVQERSGMGAVSKQGNIADMNEQRIQNKRNARNTADGSAREADTIAQLAQNAYFKQGGVWVENSVVQQSPDQNMAPRYDRIVQIGTSEYMKVADRLISENRQSLLALDGSVNIRLGDEFILLQNTITP